jgi:hypothetical protein
VSENMASRGESTDLYARRRAYELVRAVLSAEQDKEARARAARTVAAAVLDEAGIEGLTIVTVDLSLTLASALERIAIDHGLVAADLAEVWFMD